MVECLDLRLGVIGMEMLLSILAKMHMCVFINQSKNIKVFFKNIADRRMKTSKINLTLSSSILYNEEHEAFMNDRGNRKICEKKGSE